MTTAEREHLEALGAELAKSAPQLPDHVIDEAVRILAASSNTA